MKGSSLAAARVNSNCIFHASWKNAFVVEIVGAVSCHTISLDSVEAHHIKPRLKITDKSNKARMFNHVQGILVHDDHPRNLMPTAVWIKSKEWRTSSSVTPFWWFSAALKSNQFCRCTIWAIILLTTKQYRAGTFRNVSFKMTGASYFRSLTPYHYAPPFRSEQPYHYEPSFRFEEPYHHAPPPFHSEQPYHYEPPFRSEEPYHHVPPFRSEEPYHHAPPFHSEQPYHYEPPFHSEEPYHHVPPFRSEEPYHHVPPFHFEQPYHHAPLFHFEQPYHYELLFHSEQPYHYEPPLHSDHSDQPYHHELPPRHEPPYHCVPPLRCELPFLHGLQLLCSPLEFREQ
nr:DUF320 domain-containing protein [Ipomoea batatas]